MAADCPGGAAGPVLYRAPWVVPVASPVLADGGVLVQHGRIVAVDRFSRLAGAAQRVVDLDGRLLLPALINCHCHLELSHLEALGRAAPGNGRMTEWIRALLAQRAQAVGGDEVLGAARGALAGLHRRGTALVVDIGNQAASAEIGVAAPTEVLFFHEVLGSTEAAAQAVLASLTGEGEGGYTAHAPYSCHPRLLQAVKGRARRLAQLFTIHVAESGEEVEFLRSGGGPFRDFLDERLRLAGLLAPGQDLAEVLATPGRSPVAHLDALGLVDERTLCVHVVHAGKEDLELLRRRRAKICLCPGSNRALGVGTAPLPEMLGLGLLPGLGTDSLASNSDLDLWREMGQAQADHPGVGPETILRLATLGGAEALGVEHRLGSIAPGREAKLLSVAFSGPEADIFPFLVNGGAALDINWVDTPHG